MNLLDAKAAVPFDFVIWTADECAAYFRMSTSRFLRDRQYEPGFPAPLKLSGHPRWRAIEVCNWALGISRQNPPTEKAA